MWVWVWVRELHTCTHTCTYTHTHVEPQPYLIRIKHRYYYEISECLRCCVRPYSIPVYVQIGHKGSRMLRRLEFSDHRHMNVVRVSALSTGRIYPPGKILVLISVRGWVDPRAAVRPEGLRDWKSQIPYWELKPQTLAQCLNQLRYRLPCPMLYRYY